MPKDQKTIVLNPEFLSMSSRRDKRTRKRKKREKKAKPKTLVKPNKLRKQLLARIKDYQKKSEEGSSDIQVKTDLEEFDNDFNKSIDFLNELSKKKEDKSRKKKERKTHKRRKRRSENKPTDHIPVSLDMPSDMNIETRSQSHTSASVSTGSDSARQTVKMRHKEAPPYSTLKNSTSGKPTYREWVRKSQGCSSAPKITIADRQPVAETERSVRLKEIKREHKRQGVRAFRHKRTRTVKYKLGKTGRKVCVLIKDRETRKRVQREHTQLKQKSILDVKNYLREQNLLKAGSNAPNDVLRQMYEQAKLAGSVSNKASDNLIHNYLAT